MTSPRNTNRHVPIPLPQPKKVRRRFFSLLDVADRDQCWEWQGSISTSGYGRFKMRSHQNVGTHRFAYAIHYSRDPGQLLVCHRCDNRKCCNPHHLFLGTAKDNALDRMAKGRTVSADQRGSKNGNCRLQENDVRRIRELFEQGLNNQKIASRYGVTHSMISRIRTGRSWEHLK